MLSNIHIFRLIVSTFLLAKIVFIKGLHGNGVICERFDELQSELMKCEFVSFINHPTVIVSSPGTMDVYRVLLMVFVCMHSA